MKKKIAFASSQARPLEMRKSALPLRGGPGRPSAGDVWRCRGLSVGFGGDSLGTQSLFETSYDLKHLWKLWGFSYVFWDVFGWNIFESLMICSAPRRGTELRNGFSLPGIPNQTAGWFQTGGLLNVLKHPLTWTRDNLQKMMVPPIIIKHPETPSGKRKCSYKMLQVTKIVAPPPSHSKILLVGGILFLQSLKIAHWLGVTLNQAFSTSSSRCSPPPGLSLKGSR